MDEEAKKAKQVEIERKRAEVRRTMDESLIRADEKWKAKGKKGFMSPLRRRNLKLLVNKKYFEELMNKQKHEADERRRIIEGRCGQQRDLQNANEAELKAYCIEYYDRICLREAQKWDSEYKIKKTDWEIADIKAELSYAELSYRRGKFNKNNLQYVRRFKATRNYESKFNKPPKTKLISFNFRDQLKAVKKKQFNFDEE